jgi:hypothetical protein
LRKPPGLDALKLKNSIAAIALGNSKQAESEYHARLGEDGIAHSLRKPFSDENCAQYPANPAAFFAPIDPPHLDFSLAWHL